MDNQDRTMVAAIAMHGLMADPDYSGDVVSGGVALADHLLAELAKTSPVVEPDQTALSQEETNQQSIWFVPIKMCPVEWRDKRRLLVCDKTGHIEVRYWHPGVRKWIGPSPYLSDAKVKGVALLPSDQSFLPPGYVVVPVVPTEAMCEAAAATGNVAPVRAWAAMINAAIPFTPVKNTTE